MHVAEGAYRDQVVGVLRPPGLGLPKRAVEIACRDEAADQRDAPRPVVGVLVDGLAQVRELAGSGLLQPVLRLRVDGDDREGRRGGRGRRGHGTEREAEKSERQDESAQHLEAVCEARARSEKAILEALGRRRRGRRATACVCPDS